jgi:protein SCO1/2
MKMEILRRFKIATEAQRHREYGLQTYLRTDVRRLVLTGMQRRRDRSQTCLYYYNVILISITLLFLLSCGKPDPTKQYAAAITEFATPQESLPYFKTKDLQPVWFEKEEIGSHKELRGISPFTMTDQSNQTITINTMKGKLSVVSFFFTKCAGICPTITNQLRRVQDSIGENQNVKIFSFSATPDLDTPAVMSNYAKERGVDNTKWHLLTGKRDEIYKLARESFNADTITAGEKKRGRGDGDFLHSESIYLLDKNQRLRGIYNGKSSLSVDELIGDIRTLESE